MNYVMYEVGPDTIPVKEPSVHAQAFVYSAYRGPYFVIYPEGFASALMSRGEAQKYARLFGGKVYRHSQLPPWYVKVGRWLRSIFHGV